MGIDQQPALTGYRMTAAMRIVYLPFRAMAEPTRMLLALGGVKYSDEAVWGTAFQFYKAQELYPYAKTPVMVLSSDTGDDADGSEDTLTMAQRGYVVAQSGSLARYAAKLAGRYPTTNPMACAVSDSIFELGQELCTVNPLVNCYTGDHFNRVEQHYFRDVTPVALPQLDHQLAVVGSKLAAVDDSSGRPGDGGIYFAGNSATYGDVNVFHMLSNAMLLQPDLLVRTPGLEDWYWRMQSLPGLAQFLKNRPTLNGISDDPGLEDRNGVRVTQQTSPGRAWLVDGCWELDSLHN